MYSNVLVFSNFIGFSNVLGFYNLLENNKVDEKEVSVKDDVATRGFLTFFGFEKYLCRSVFSFLA